MKKLRFKQLIQERIQFSKTGEETLLSVSEYYGVKPRTEAFKSEEYETSAATLEGYRVVKKDDLVMNYMLAWKGAYGVSNYDGIVSPAYSVFKIDRQIVDVRFLHHRIRSDDMKAYFRTRSKGIIQSRLRLYPDSLLASFVDIPDLTTQRRIADFLDHETARIDLLIEKKQCLVALLDEKRRAMVSAAVTPDFFLTSHRLSGLVCESAVGHGGARVQLRRVASIRNKKSIFSNRLRPYVGLEHITRWTGEITPSEDAQPEGLVAHFKASDILFGKLRPYLAKVSAPKFKGVCSTEALVINPGRGVETRFLQYLLSESSFIKRVSAATYGAKMPRASWETIGAEGVYVPDLAVQREIADFLDSETAKIDMLSKKIMSSVRCLKEFRLAMINAAVTGQIDLEICARSNTRS